MLWLEKLRAMKERSGLTTKEIAGRANIPEPTLEKLFAGATKDPKLSTMQQLVHFFGCTLDDLDDEPRKAKPAPSGLSEEAKTIARAYDRLDDRDRNIVQTVVQVMREKPDESAPAAPELKTIPLFGSSFAAGMGEPDFGNAWEDYEVPADSPADFAVRIHGDSMEPYLHDGEIALGRKDTPRDGDVAALLLDGTFLVKQVCADSQHNLYLFALNRARADTDRTIWHDSGRSLMCFGTIILGRRVPLP